MMLLKTIQMKSLNNKIALPFFLILFSSGIAMAQEIIKESVIDTIKTQTSNQKQKIDGVIAKVGDY